MNRRNFLKNILVAGASFSILPSAGRLWKAEREFIHTPNNYLPSLLYPNVWFNTKNDGWYIHDLNKNEYRKLVLLCTPRQPISIQD